MAGDFSGKEKVAGRLKLFFKIGDCYFYGGIGNLCCNTQKN